MAKTIIGTVISTGMQHTVVVETTRHVPHPLYKKLLARSKKFKADSREVSVAVGDRVRIAETKPLSKDKQFKVIAKVSEKEQGEQ